jgi:uncharacterized repeat protein (TIGR01451 family)
MDPCHFTSLEVGVLAKCSGVRRIICLVLLLWVNSGRSQTNLLDHFTWSTIPPQVQAGQGFAISIVARDLMNNRVFNFGGTVALIGLLSNPPPKLLITEVETILTQRVEVANLSPTTIDISGLQLVLYDSLTWPNPRVTLTIPPGTICPAAALFQARSIGSYPGSFPNFQLGVELNWGSSGQFPYTAAALLDSTGRLVDFFCAREALPASIAQPRPITHADWSGLPVAGNQNQSFTYQRVGVSDHHNASDWIATNNSFLAMNKGLLTPFIASPTKLPIDPGTVSFSNGIWAGEIRITSGATNLVLRADDLQGHAGDTAPLTVLGPPSLQIQVPPQTFEATAGFAGFGQVILPSSLSTNLTVHLFSSDTNEIFVPATINLLAGSTNGAFAITNLDDQRLDGAQVVTVTAMATSFAAASGLITNYEIGNATLSLQVPLNAREGDSMYSNNWVLVSAPVDKDVIVYLASSDTNELALPDMVVIPAGATSNKFTLQVIEDSRLDGPQSVIISAKVPFWNGTQVTVVIADNEATNLSIQFPAQVAEGSGVLTNLAAVSISGSLQTNLSVNLNSSIPSRFQIPANVLLPAGQTSSFFTVTVADDPQMQGNQTVTVSASATGLGAAQTNVVITDNDVQFLGFAAVPSPQFLGQAFPASIFAKAVDGQTVRGFSGSVSLGTLNGAMSAPTLQVILSNGTWTGLITLTNGSTNVMLTASGPNGLRGQSNPFNLVRPAIRQVSLPTQDLISEPFSGRLFATVPANGGAMSNSLVRLEPRTGAIESSAFIGLAPNKLAASDDGQYLYIGLDGESMVRRFDLSTQTVGPAFSIGTGLWALDLEVMPGTPHVVAVSRSEFSGGFGPRGIAIYDHGLKRPMEFPDATVVTPASSSILYGYHNYTTAFTFYRLSVSSNGVSLLNYSSPLLSGFADIQYDQGRIYTTLGQVVDPELTVRLGRLPASGPVRSESSLNRVYVLGQNSGNWVLAAYDRTTLALNGSMAIPGVAGSPSSLVRWGHDGLAFRTSGNQIFLIETELVPQMTSADLEIQQSSSPTPILAGTDLSYTLLVTNKGLFPATAVLVQDQLPSTVAYVSASSSKGTYELREGTVVAQLGSLLAGETATLTITVRPANSGTITNSALVTADEADPIPANNATVQTAVIVPAQNPTSVAMQLLAVSDLAWHPASQRIYATVRGNDPQLGNRLVRFDPISARVEASYFVGNEPGQLSFSSDYHYLYIAADAGARVRRFDVIAQSVDLTLELDPGLQVDDLAPLNGRPGSVAITRMVPEYSPSGAGMVLYDNAVSRFTSTVPYRIEPGEDSSTLYDYVKGSATYMFRYQLGSNAMMLDKSIQIQETYFGDFHYDVGLLVTAQGDVLYGPTLSRFGVLTNIPASATARLVTSDAADGRIYHLTQNFQSATLRVFSRNRLELLNSSTIGGLGGTATSLIRWGSNGLAFCTTANQLFLLRSPQVPSISGADLVVTQSPPLQIALFQPFSCSVTVSNRGPALASDVVLTDVLPQGGALVSAALSKGTWLETNGQVVCSIGALTPGETVSLNLSIITHEPGALKNGVVVAAGSRELNPLDNFSTLAMPVPFLATLPLPVNDIAYDGTRDKIMAAVGPGGGPLSNSIVAIDRSSGFVGSPIVLPDTPMRVAVSDDGQFLYAGLARTGGVWRVNLASNSVDLFFSLGVASGGFRYTAGDLKVMPGQAHTIAVSINNAAGNVAVAVFDDGIPRANIVSHPDSGATYPIAFSTNVSILYGAFPNTLERINVTSSGVSLAEQLSNLAPTYQYFFQPDAGLLFFDSGRQVDPVAKTIITNFPTTDGLVAPDTAAGQLLAVTGKGAAPFNWQLTLHGFELSTTRELWSIPLLPAQGYAVRLIRLGTNGLALSTDAGRLFIIQTAQLSQPRVDLSLTQAVSPNPTIAGASTTCSFIIRNLGPFSATSVVFSNPLPANARALTITTSQGTLLQTNPAVLCHLGTMTNAAIASVTITYQLLTNGTFVNTGFVTAAQNDPYPPDNTSAAQIIANIPPSLTIGDATIREGNSGFPSMTFNLNLSAVSPVPVYVGYETSDGTAIAGADYNAKSGLFTFNPGTLTRQLALSQVVRANTTIQSNRFFYVNLTTITNVFLIRTQATATILDDDYRSVSVTNVAILEKDTGWTNLLLNVRLAPPASTPVSVDYQTLAGTATPGSDYLAKAGTLTFPPGVTNLAVNVSVLGDTLPEINESFTFLLSQPEGVVLATSQVQATILNDDSLPVLAINGYAWQGSYLNLSFDTIAGRSYRLERSDTLRSNSWVVIADQVLGTGQTAVVSDADAASRIQGFYRLVLLP